MQVPFGEWLPDQPEHNNPGANVANNVYYALNSYKRFPSLVNYSTNTITKNSRGAGSFRDNSNTVFNFVANEETIFELTGGAFTERGARGKVLSTAFATCTITVSDYANIGASKTVTLKKMTTHLLFLLQQLDHHLLMNFKFKQITIQLLQI